MDNIVHNRRYFYSESNETFQSKSDVRVRPMTKAVNEPSGWTRWRGASVDAGRPTSAQLQ